MTGIGFFAPLPLAMMLPFMAGQSMVMGEAFGKSFQYGKRKISAMSNDEFNKLTPEDLGKQLQTDYLTLIPSLKASIASSRDFQKFVIQEMADLIRSIPKDVISSVIQQDSNPISTIVDQLNTQKTQPANIDYGQIALATIKILLGPLGSTIVDPQFQEASAYRGDSSSLRDGIVQGPTEGPQQPLKNEIVNIWQQKQDAYKSRTLSTKAKPIIPETKVIDKRFLLHFKVKDTTPQGKPFLRGDVAFGDKTFHIRNIKKWKSSQRAKPTKYLLAKIEGYQAALIRHYGFGIAKLL